MSKSVVMIASGDLRLSANRVCWPAQQQVEEAITRTVESFGFEIKRGHPVDAVKQHGFIDSQKYGMDVFRQIDPGMPLVVVEAVWQYSHHILHGLATHRAPILTVANWSGQWPGLVGMLNLNGSLTKAGVEYSTLWAESFASDDFRKKLGQWLNGKKVKHDLSHVTPFQKVTIPGKERKLGEMLAAQLQNERA